MSFCVKQSNLRIQQKILDISSLRQILDVGLKTWCRSVSVHIVCLYQTAELEQSRRTSSMVVESGCVSMGTGAPLPPQVFVIVNSMKTLLTLSSRAPFVGLLSSSCRIQRFDEVCLVLEAHKPPAVQNRNFRRVGNIFFLLLKQISV